MTDATAAASPPVGHPLRFSTIAHAGRTILGPVSADRADALVAALQPAPGARIVELGCGKADLLIRILRRWPGVSAEGFDRDPWFLADARAAAEAAGVLPRLSLIETDAPGARLAGREVDLAIAIGATGIVGGQRETVAFLASIVGPGGVVVFGDGVWSADPPEAGLRSFGMERAELVEGCDGLAALGVAAGLELEGAEVVSIGEWDAYEAAYVDAVLRWADEQPDDAERSAFLARAAAMRDSYASWRRGTMGFAIGRFSRV